MVTMVDEIFDRSYQAGRNELNATLSKAFRRFGRAVIGTFEVLVRIQFEAPWIAKSKRARCN